MCRLASASDCRDSDGSVIIVGAGIAGAAIGHLHGNSFIRALAVLMLICVSAFCRASVL